ncbi:MAG: trigger factor [Bacteroidales bacterium]|nr:trigger factor [Bacteroidales bacterium]
MNVTLDKTSDIEGKFIVNVEEADYEKKVKDELKKIGREAHIPGFRQGHVPAGQIKARFGKQAKSQVLNDTVYEAVINYIRDNKINVLGEPMPVEVKEVNLDDKDYTFEYEIGLAPVLDIKLDKDVKLPYYTIAVSDEMLAEQDKNLCQRLGSQVPGEEVDERAVVKGVLMQLNEDGTVNENPGAIQVVNGIVAPFYFKDKDEAAKFAGKKVDDKVVFNPWKSCEGNAAELASMLNLDKNIAADVKGDFQMTISEIIVHKPAEHNQEFFDNVFGKDKVKDEDEYKKALTEMIARDLAGNSEQLFQADAEKYLIDKYGDMQLPVAFLKKWLVARNEELTAENIDKEFEAMLPSLKWQLIRERVSADLNVELKEEDLLDYAKGVAYHQFAQYGITNMDDETIEQSAKRLLNDRETRSRLVERLSDLKLMNAVKGAVTLEDKTVSLDEFRELVKAHNEANA